MNALIVPEHIFIFPVTGTKHNKLCTIGTDIVHDTVNEI